MNINFAEIDPSKKIDHVIQIADDIAKEKKLVDPGLSTIEASQIVATILVPLISIPLLPPPAQNNLAIQGMSSIFTSMNERQKIGFLNDIAEQLGKASSDLNKIYIQSLERIIEDTNRILNSQTYKDERDYKRTQSFPTKTSDVLDANRNGSLSENIQTSRDELKGSIMTLSHLLEDLKAQKDIAIPFPLLMTVAGTLALGKLSDSKDISKDLADLVQKLQPAIPQDSAASSVSTTEIIPLINLMIMIPIIFRPLDESIKKTKKGQDLDPEQLVRNFAKDVIKMVTDPSFALLSIVNNVENINHLNDEQKRAFESLLKLILLSVALSLVYSSEVGKIHNNKFLGMEAKEFEALLNPENPLIVQKHGDKLNPDRLLAFKLIKQIRIQMSELPLEERTHAMEAILQFLGQHNHIKKLLEPSKVLTEILEAMNYKVPINQFIRG